MLLDRLLDKIFDLLKNEFKGHKIELKTEPSVKYADALDLYFFVNDWKTGPIHIYLSDFTDHRYAKSLLETIKSIAEVAHKYMRKNKRL